METNGNSEFKTGCPSCRLVMLAQNEWIGMGTECPRCKTKFIIHPLKNKISTLDLRKYFTKKAMLALSIGVFTIAVITTACIVWFSSSNKSVSRSKGLSEYEKIELKSYFKRKYYLSDREADELVTRGYISNGAIDVMYKVQASGLAGDFSDDLKELHNRMKR